MSPEEWLMLVALLSKQGPVCVAKEDKKFFDQMINQLTVDEPLPVLPWQKKWLLAVKKECRL